MTELNEKTYINNENVVIVQQIDDKYYILLSSGQQIAISKEIFDLLKEYEGGGGGGTSYSAGNGIDITGKVISNTYADVEANPTLAGNEDTLEGLEVDGVKYAVGGGGKQLYQHNINIQLWNTDYGWIGLKIIDSDNSSFTYAKLKQWLENNGFSRVGHSSAMRDKGFSVVGYELDSTKKPIYNIYVDTNENSIGYNAQGTYGSFNSESITNFNDIIIPL